MQYRRNYVKGGTYFFTVNLLDRNKSLLVEHIDLLRESIRFVKSQKPFYIDAWVVLPDHLHAVLTLPDDDVDYSSRWREIKKRFSKSLPKTEFLTQTRKRKNERGIWQRRFWEHTIRDDNDYWHHVNYVHFNPLKHGLVSQVADWPYLSFHRAVKQGIYANNWCG
ncbi:MULTISPECIES: REP-associated tyrosine transposase [Pseudoalteromonas]|uniref:REP-associated tyrosine transposase n=1 Tax=Pseudoalteromonas TaxID=53246 RepID=UPI00057B0C68|nr:MULTISPECIES: transposase [Pseudoalteromonas]ATG58069.1 transposase [Pseudoalteromonas marina]